MKIKFRHKPAPHVPFIALADIAWQIIIFFLVASSFAQNQSLNVDLPSGSSQSQSTSESNVTVQAGESVLMLDGRTTEMGELQATLTRLLESRSTEQGKAVVLELRDDLSFQCCADIMYAVQQAGGTVVFSEAGEQ